jgi:hypothetical protein
VMNYMPHGLVDTAIFWFRRRRTGKTTLIKGGHRVSAAA